MIDHISVGVSDLERSARFYEAALAPLGLARLVSRPATVGFGKDYPEFWINFRDRMPPVAPETGVHICLRGQDRRLPSTPSTPRRAGAGGCSPDGAPGLRPHDLVRYYAAFIVDPDGNRIEAVTFPEG